MSEYQSNLNDRPHNLHLETCPGTHPEGVGAFQAQSKWKSLIAISLVLVEQYSSAIPLVKKFNRD